MTEERMRILEMIEQGVITPDEGSQLLAALDESAEMDFEDPEFFPDTPEPELSTEEYVSPNEPLEDIMPEAGWGGSGPAKAEFEDEPAPEPPPDMGKWRRWWVYPLTGGVVLTILSTLLLMRGIRAEWAGFWLACTWLPLLLGTGLVAVAWFSRSARWLHVRVNTGQDEWPRRVAISFPLPIKTTAWFLRIFGNKIPALDGTGIDELILALGDSATPETPLYVEVDEGANGEQVQVYIG
jgi:hypothetical protein